MQPHPHQTTSRDTSRVVTRTADVRGEIALLGLLLLAFLLLLL